MKPAATLRTGDWLQTFTGRQFWPLDPRADEIHIDDIAHALSCVCRFGGHGREFYSVAQHSVFVATMVERAWPEIALHALLHDAAEAYIGDVTAPLKQFVRVLRNHIDEPIHLTERRILEQIRIAFGLRELNSREVTAIRVADAGALATEARDLMGDPKWPGLPAPDPARIEPVPPAAAKRAFLCMFERLRGTGVA